MDLNTKLKAAAPCKLENDSKRNTKRALLDEFKASTRPKRDDLIEIQQACDTDKASLCTEIDAYRGLNYDEFCRQIKQCDDDWAEAQFELDELAAQRERLILAIMDAIVLCEESDRQVELLLIEMDEQVNGISKPAI